MAPEGRARLFWRQLVALCILKNFVILRQHWLRNLLRAIILPIGFGLFLAYAPKLLVRPNELGFSEPAPIYALQDVFTGGRLIWTDTTNGTGSPNADQIMTMVLKEFSSAQLAGVTKVGSTDDVTAGCPSNYNGRSPCFAAVTFTGFPTSSNTTAPLQYYITGDAGLAHVNVPAHASDYEKHILPLQWAIDSAYIQLRSGIQLPTPLEQPFTQETDAEQAENTRISYLKNINQIFVIGFYLCFTGILYQTAGAVATERVELLSSHMQAMGCLRSARLLSWHASLSISYFPAWIISAVFWQNRIFTHTNIGIVIGVNLLAGLSLASWATLVSMRFPNNAQLAAIVANTAGIVINILARAFVKTNGIAIIFTLVFPPSFFTIALRAIIQRELWVSDPNYDPSVPYPSNNIKIGSEMFLGALNVFISMSLAMLIERNFYDAKPGPSSSGLHFFGRLLGKSTPPTLPTDGVPSTDGEFAIRVRHISKTFNEGKKKEAVAIENLSLDIPKHGVFVILGSNGSGKSTLHGMIGHLITPSGGFIAFEGGAARPARGKLGIVPQKNVLWPELTCLQTVRLWSAIKRPLGTSASDAELTQLLVDCDLADKINFPSGKLSGGQKRKLQLAIGIVGESEILLVDEATSGVDPVSRRAIWRTLNKLRSTRTIIFTTHFLDEADLLGDEVAILAAPGKLLAQASPVSLKRNLGRGYILHIVLDRQGGEYDLALQTVLNRIRTITPEATVLTSFASNATIQLETRDTHTVAAILTLVESEKQDLGILQYNTHATSLEEVFLAMMAKEGAVSNSEPGHGEPEKTPMTPPPIVQILSKTETERQGDRRVHSLSDGQRISVLTQALVIFRKRALAARRAWISPLLSIAIVVAASCIPLLLMRHRHEDCSINEALAEVDDLYLPDMLDGLSSVLNVPGSSYTFPIVYPTNATSVLNDSSFPVIPVPAGMTFTQDISTYYRNLTTGGISLDPTSHQALIAYESSSGSLAGAELLNLATNVLANELRGTTGPQILAQYANFPATFSTGTGDALSWLGFFGLGIGIFPAFFTLYITKERVSGVKSMQLSNGLTPAGLYLGHLLAEMPVILTSSTIVIIVWTAAASRQFADLGLMWFIFVLFGINAALFSYTISRFLPSALVAFATLATYNVLSYILYVAAYLLTLTYAPAVTSASESQIVHYTMSLLGPVPSILRAVLVSVNLFALRCNGRGGFSHTSNGSMVKYGGPLTYLIVYSAILFSFLVWWDSGRPFPFWHRKRAATVDAHSPAPDVANEAERARTTDGDPLRVLNIAKRFRGSKQKAVDDVSFGVRGETLGLLGPNGAGKTTTFDIIRGSVTPDEGDVFINKLSIRGNKTAARVGLGLCPQFTAIDPDLTVRDHLNIYGRLKGLRGQNLETNIETMLQVTTLTEYTHRAASKLSGGNQRKLALAVALMGNPSVLLIDEYSTGIDPATKRQMWNTLRELSPGKAVVITTHSMEEASALSDRVAILSGRLLAIGTVEDLVSRYPIYEIHVSCRTPDEVQRTQEAIQARFPDARPADDVSTRWEVPITSGRTLSNLFDELCQEGLPEYAVERLSLESVFLKTIRGNTFTTP